MKTLLLGIIVSGSIAFYGCSETKDATENSNNTAGQNTSPQTEQTPVDESNTKEKAGENKTEVTEKDADVKLKVKDSKLQSASFTAASMHCTGCESSIENNVKKLDGVQDVKASFDTKQIEVTFAGDKVTKQDIADAITASGFECKINE